LAALENNSTTLHVLLIERWQAHLQSTTIRPVLLIDEAQEMPLKVLNELCFLSSTDYDSHTLLSIVLARDARLQTKCVVMNHCRWETDSGYDWRWTDSTDRPEWTLPLFRYKSKMNSYRFRYHPVVISH